MTGAFHQEHPDAALASTSALPRLVNKADQAVVTHGQRDGAQRKRPRGQYGRRSDVPVRVAQIPHQVHIPQALLSALRYGYGMIAYAYDHATPRAASPGRFHHASGRRRHGPTHTGRAHRLGSWRIPACAGQLQRSDRPTIALSGQVYRSELTRFRSRPRHPMPMPYGRGQPSVRARPDRCTEDRGPRVESARPSSACHNVSGVPPCRRGACCLSANHQ